MNDPHQNHLRADYTARVNRVIDYIEANISQELSLEALADVANFSKFHFHRLFGALTGEKLNQFIQRIRVEKAAGQLIRNPKKSITEIALDCGFSGSAAFARAFKSAFQMSASEWRSGGHQEHHRKIRKMDRNEGQTVGKIWQDSDRVSMYIDPVTNNIIWRIKMLNKNDVNVEVKALPEMQVAYVRHIGPYQGDSELFAGLFGKLMAWAGPRGVLQQPDMKMLSIYHDDPDITTDERLRVEVCVSIPEEMAVEGEIGKMLVAGGQYAVGRFELSAQEYTAAWQAIYGEWLPQSGYQPDDRPAYELYLNNPEEHPEHKHIVDICVPVKPL